MANPKQRHSNTRTNQRRSHHALKGITLAVCPKCGAAKKPHYACPACGDYDGNDTTKKKVTAVKKVAVKKAAKPAKETKSKTAKAAKKSE